MSPRDSVITRSATRAIVPLLVLALSVAICPTASAQDDLFRTNAVGGVLIDPAGMLSNATSDDLGQLARLRSEIVAEVPEGLDTASGQRRISLRLLDEAVRQSRESGEPLPPEVAMLGGLQRIRYVLVYPEQRDIVLVGPADAWKVNQRGAVVGATNGRPVMMLDDLLVALRSAHAPVRSVISCSIDPTPEGVQRLTAFGKRLRAGADPRAVATEMERRLGPQQISVDGVPETSHFARVMVAADYRMKRIGMNLEPAPVPGLPGFMELMRSSGRRGGNMLPRWWLAPESEPLLRDADGLSWELPGVSVKAMTETDFFDAAGVRHETGRADPASQKWADLMTERYDELAMADPVFGQLQNCVDLAVVAALIARENLVDRAQASLPMLLGSDGLQTAEFPAPKQVASQASLARKGRWMIACGGVQINPWAIAEKAETTDALAQVRSKAAFDSTARRWWD